MCGVVLGGMGATRIPMVVANVGKWGVMLGGTGATGIPMAVVTGRWEVALLRVLNWSGEEFEVTTASCW